MSGSSAPEQKSTTSIIASNVPLNLDENKIIRDLEHNYLGVEQVSRLYDENGKLDTAVQIDFTSANFVKSILDKHYILIDGKRCPVRSYQSHTRSQNHKEDFDYTQKPLARLRLGEWFK